MKRLLTSAQMKFCDERQINGGTPSITLMERAASAVYDALLHWFDTSRTLVVCGGGNNGCDGLICASLLHRDGKDCRIVSLAPPEKQNSQFKTLLQKCAEEGIEIYNEVRCEGCTAVVDALFGTGLTREPVGVYAEAIRMVNASGIPVLAVDMPSGVSADTGIVPGAAMRAEMTVSMAAFKRGQAMNPEGINCCGKVICANIGIDTEGFEPEDDGISPFVIDKEDMSLLLPRNACSNKGDFGRVLVMAGSRGMCGAAFLSALAAYRCGAGIVEIFTPECNRGSLQTLLPEAVVTAYSGHLPDVEMLRSSLMKARCAVVGPGLSTDSAARVTVRECFRQSAVPIICDADALNVCAADSLAFPTDVPVIVTPHPGELSRLSELTVANILDNPFESARNYAAENGVVCVSKLSRTVISDGREVFVNIAGSPALSKGGSGDVLTGVIAGMLCQGLSPMGAACLGVYIHSIAGEKLQREQGVYSPLARELADACGSVLADINNFYFMK